MGNAEHGQVLPNLILPGFPKCGTTSVAETLVGHPAVCGAFPHRATHHFTPLLYDKNTSLGSPDDYSAHFSTSSVERIRLDDTVIWMYGSARIARAVRDVLGDVKILVMLREPASRTASYLTWKKHNAQIDQDISLAEYVEQCDALGPHAVDTEGLNAFSGVHGSHYPKFLEPWLDEFGDLLKIGFTDDLRDRPVDFYQSLAAWLEIDPSYFTGDTITIANIAQSIRSARAEKIVRRVGRIVQPLAASHPGVYRRLRSVARKANTHDAPPPNPDAGTLAELQIRYRPDRARTLELISGHTLLGAPEWLNSH